jgi:DNA replication protein DnaC
MERIKTDEYRLPTASALISPSDEPESAMTTKCIGCGDAGFYLLAVPYGHPDWGKPQRCECQAGKPLPGHVAMLARLRDDLGHLADCAFETFSTDRHLKVFTWDYDGAEYDVERQRDDLNKAYIKAMDYSSAVSGWLYLFGNYGAGKSHLAAAIANRAARLGTRTTYASVPKLLDFIRAGYRDGSASERIEALQGVPLLVLDDLGAEAGKKDTEELLFVLFNHRSRERANLPTVITSNVHPDDLEPRIADRIFGQTDGGARIVWMPIFSFRRLR